MATERIAKPFPGYSLLAEQMSRIQTSAARARRVAIRGRPPRQPEVLDIFRTRLRAGLTEQVWMRERRQIERAWSAANPPSDRTIKRAISKYYQRLQWKDGRVTGASALVILEAIAGQK